jgi:hypothetical protein
VYASVIHCREVVDARSARDRVGSATFTMELSTTTSSKERQSTARVAQRRAWIVSGVIFFMSAPTC